MKEEKNNQVAASLGYIIEHSVSNGCIRLCFNLRVVVQLYYKLSLLGYKHRLCRAFVSTWFGFLDIYQKIRINLLFGYVTREDNLIIKIQSFSLGYNQYPLMNVKKKSIPGTKKPLLSRIRRESQLGFFQNRFITYFTISIDHKYVTRF